MLFVSYVRHSDKILILNKEGIIEKISYERRAYLKIKFGHTYTIVTDMQIKDCPKYTPVLHVHTKINEWSQCT